MKTILHSTTYTASSVGIALLALLLPTSSFAHNESLPDDHAPIAVMPDHHHKQGEWMFSYRYSRMQMKGNRNGDSTISTADVLTNFAVAPLNMTMEMHMFGGMYGINDRFTLMTMLPYVRKSMDLYMGAMNREFSTQSEGIGDASVSGLYQLYASEKDPASHRITHTLLLGAGLSLPTGSIDERDDTPMAANQKLPYPMQLGSGTFDPKLSLTYTQKHDGWSWGAQGNTVLRMGTNDEGYRLGNEYGLTTWASKTFTHYLSGSLRLEGKRWNDIHGTDKELNPAMVPTARADLRGGTRLDMLVGVNLLAPTGTLKGHRLAVEFGMPVYQHLDGPQLETDYRLTVGWQKAF